MGPWGLLPLVAPVFAFVAARLGALAFRGCPQAGTSDRAVAGVLLAFATVIGGVRALSVAHAVSTGGVLALLLTLALLVGVIGRDAPFLDRNGVQDHGVAAVILVAGLALALALVAARWLPVWQWDALGYHLPFVHFTLAAGSVDGVPPELPYAGSYPHDVELFFVALRACLPDDRLVDLGQIPFGIGGATVTAALARSAGADRGLAIVAGASWLLVPAVFLQLPTDYVDVASATFCLAALYFALDGAWASPLAPPSGRALVLGGLAVGLVAGTKPSGPLPGVILLGVLVARGLHARRWGAAATSVSLAVAFGAGAYVDNFVHHANPVWPVAMDLGPIHLPGTRAFDEVLHAGERAPHLTGSLPSRMVRSLFALGSPPVYDMRVGGFGLLTLVALPFAIALLVRRRSLAGWLALAVTLAAPDPAVARYVLAFPAFVSACAAAYAQGRISRRASSWLSGLVGALGAVTLAYAAPGLTGEGPPLIAYASMSEPDRAVAVGADGRPTDLAFARSRVRSGEAFAFDEDMDLSDLAWEDPRHFSVVFLPPSLAGDALGRELDARAVRVVVAGDLGPAAAWLKAHPLEFEKLPSRVSCRRATCSVFERL